MSVGLQQQDAMSPYFIAIACIIEITIEEIRVFLKEHVENANEEFELNILRR